MICTAHPKQMAHQLCLSQWHCSLDVIPKQWHPLQYPFLWSLYDQITLVPSFISMCCLLWCCRGFYWLKIRVLNDWLRLAAHRHICFLICSYGFIWCVGGELMQTFAVLCIPCVWHKTVSLLKLLNFSYFSKEHTVLNSFLFGFKLFFWLDTLLFNYYQFTTTIPKNQVFNLAFRNSSVSNTHQGF